MSGAISSSSAGRSTTRGLPSSVTAAASSCSARPMRSRRPAGPCVTSSSSSVPASVHSAPPRAPVPWTARRVDELQDLGQVQRRAHRPQRLPERRRVAGAARRLLLALHALRGQAREHADPLERAPPLRSRGRRPTSPPAAPTAAPVRRSATAPTCAARVPRRVAPASRSRARAPRAPTPAAATPRSSAGRSVNAARLRPRASHPARLEPLAQRHAVRRGLGPVAALEQARPRVPLEQPRPSHPGALGVHGRRHRGAPERVRVAQPGERPRDLETGADLGRARRAARRAAHGSFRAQEDLLRQGDKGDPPAKGARRMPRPGRRPAARRRDRAGCHALR